MVGAGRAVAALPLILKSVGVFVGLLSMVALCMLTNVLQAVQFQLFLFSRYHENLFPAGENGELSTIASSALHINIYYTFISDFESICPL